MIGAPQAASNGSTGFEAPDDSPQAIECPLVEDGGEMRAHRPPAAERPRRLGFVDGTMRVEARLTRTGAEGDAVTGLAGSWAADAARTDEILRTARTLAGPKGGL